MNSEKKAGAMKGVRYVIDDNGKARAVQIDLKKYGRIWEDFQDVLVSRARRQEPRESLSEVENRLRALGKMK